MTNQALVKAQKAELERGVSAGDIDDWLSYEADDNEASETTVKTYGRSFGVFRKWADDNGLALAVVTPRDVSDFKKYLTKEGYSPQTVNLRLTAIRRFYAWAVVSGLTLLNPAADVKGKKRKRSRAHKRDVLTGAEVLAVLGTCDTATIGGLRDRVILSLMVFCGLRSVEVFRADIGDLRTRDDRLTLDVRGKGDVVGGGGFVVVPLREEPVVRKWLKLRKKLKWAGVGAGDPLFMSLSNRTRGKRLALRSIRDMVKGRYAAAGVVGDRKTTHSLRHSSITNAIRRAQKLGRSPMAVQAFARHKDFNTTLGYYHETGRLDDPIEDIIDYSNGK